MDDLRKPFLILAFVLLVLVVLFELGSGPTLSFLSSPPAVTTSLQSQLPNGPVKDAFNNMSGEQKNQLANLSNDPPGMAIPYMALLDGVLLFTVALITAGLLLPAEVQGRLQGFGTCLFSLLLIIGGIVMIFIALALLLLMVGLFLAIPFGTLVYLALYGFFNRGGAETALSLIMFLKLGAAVSLVLAQQRFLQQTGLVLIVLTSLLGNVIISFLQGLVPIILVSITDAIAAIVVALLAVIWALILLIGSIPGILKAIKPS